MKLFGKKRLTVYAALLLCALLPLCMFFSGCEENNEQTVVNGNYTIETGNTEDTTDGADDKTPATDETSDGATEESNDGAAEETSGLKIPISDLTTSASFYGVTVDGTYMQVIALIYNGSYRTAFNTCQVCYGSSKAYFLPSGNYLVCQNCKSKFALSQVGVASGGCNPYPIKESDRADTDEYLIIPDSYLISCVSLFKNWGGSY